jgi:streptogramin lyase
MRWIRSALKLLRRSSRESRRVPKRRQPLFVEDLEGRKLLSSGARAISLAPLAIPTSNLITGPDGDLWVAGPGHDASSFIEKIGPNGSVTAYAVPGSPEVDDLAPGPDGNVWFSAQSRGPDRFKTHGILGMVTPAGRMIEIPFRGDLGVFGAGIDAIAHGPGGDLWFAFQGLESGDVSEFGLRTAAGRIKLFPVPSSQIQMFDIAAGPDGNLWFDNDFSGVGRITPSGAVTEFANVDPAIIGNGLDGTLVVSGQNAAGQAETALLSTTGAVIPYTILPANSQAFANYVGPAGGSLWFTSLDQNGNTSQLGRLTKQGAVATYHLSAFIGSGGDFLYSIAVGPERSLYLLAGFKPVLYRIPLSKLPPPG